MKNLTKICLWISLSFVCVGAVCLGIGAALGSGLKEIWAMAADGELNVGNLHIGNWNIPYFITDDYDDGEDWEDVKLQKGYVQEQFSPDAVSGMEIDIRFGAVYLIDSDSDQIEVTVDAPSRNVYECKLDEGTLELKDKTPGSIWKGGLKRNHDAVVTIAIPEGTVFDEVSLCTNAGSIEAEHAIAADEVEINLDAGELTAVSVTAAEKLSASVGAGNLEVDRFATDHLKIDCGLGKAELTGKAVKEAEADCGVGQIILDLEGKETDYDYEIKCGLGSVAVNGEEFSTLATERNIDHHAGNKVRLDCGMGSIELNIMEE